MSNYKAFDINGEEIDLNKSNKRIAKLLGGLDNIEEVELIRKFVLKSNVYCSIDPFQAEINERQCLVMENSLVALKEYISDRRDEV